MEQSQLIEILGTLNSEEKEQVLEFSLIPFINHGKLKALVPQLLYICLKFLNHEHQKGLEKKSVFATLFPGQEFVEGKIEKVMVEAHKVVRTVLLLRHYLREGNGFQQTLDYTEIVRAKGLNGRYQHLLTRLQKMQVDNPWKNAGYFQQQFLIEMAIHLEECFHNQVKGDLNIPKVLDALELHGHLNRLALLNRFLLQQKNAKIEVSETMQLVLKESTVPEKYLLESPALKAYQLIFELLKKGRPELEDIKSLFQLLRTHEQNLDQESLQEFFTYLRNLCSIALSGDMEKVEIEFILHELFKDNLQRGYLHYEGKLHTSRYWAVSSNAIRVKDFDWAIEFIETYRHNLIGENEHQDIYHLNLANYLFGMGHFSECLDKIPASSPFVDYLLTGKRLEIKAYYELKSDLLSFKLEAFKVFLSRTSPKLLSETHKQSHVDFANLLTQISTSIPGDPKRAERVITRIQAKKQAAEWRWLLEKAKALSGN